MKTKPNEGYAIIKVGYESYVMPFEAGVMFMRAMSNTQKVSANNLDGKYTDMICITNQPDITMRVICEAQYLAMQMMGERYDREVAAK